MVLRAVDPRILLMMEDSRMTGRGRWMLAEILTPSGVLRDTPRVCCAIKEFIKIRFYSDMRRRLLRRTSCSS